MIAFLANSWYKLLIALAQHLEIVAVTLAFSLVLAVVLVIVAQYIKGFGEIMTQIFSVMYSIPSLAFFALLIPVTGLGKPTAIIVLTIYNQYLLLRNFLTGLAEVDPAVVEAATGLGMTPMQVLWRIKAPLSKKAFFTGVQLAVVSTIGIATIAALINAGGLGDILLEGLRTMNVYKILWGSILSAGLALGINAAFSALEKRLD